MLSHGTLLQNRYRIARRIGQGGMGAVYEATHEELGYRVALKETYHTDDPSIRRAFKREAKMLAGLQHPGLPRVIDYFADGDGLFLVMEYISGEDLYKLLSARQQPFPVEKVLHWAEQLIEVLEYLHGQDPPVIHRDIKPNNIKLNERGSVILLDFGLSKGAASEMTSIVASRSVLGFTLTYAPLEQILKADQNLVQHLTVLDAEKVDRVLHTPTDACCDIYSLGATLYHLLTNKQPVQSPTRALAIWSGRKDPLLRANEVNPEVPPEIADLLQKAMALDSEDRITSVAKMREVIAESLRPNLRPTDVTPPPVPVGPTEEPAASAIKSEVPPSDLEEHTVLRPRPALSSLLSKLKWEQNRLYYLLTLIVLILVIAVGTVLMLRRGAGTPDDPNSGVAARQPAATVPPRAVDFEDDKLIPFRKGNWWGFSVPDGTIVIEPKYDGVARFSEGMAMVWFEDKTANANVNRGGKSSGNNSSGKPDRKIGFIDKNGKEVIPVEYDNATPFRDGWTLVTRYGGPRCLDKNGHEGRDPRQCPTPTPTPSKSTSSSSSSSSSSQYTYEYNDNYDRCGFVDSEGRALTARIYESCNSFSEGLAAVKQNGKWGFIATNGKPKIALKFESVDSFSGGLARAKYEGKWGYIGTDGSFKILNIYEDLGPFSEGLAYARKPDEKYGYINNDGVRKIPHDYDAAESFKNSIARVKKGGGYGYIDKENKQLISFSYEYVEYPVEGGWAKIKRDNRYGFISIANKEEKEVIKPRYESIGPFNGDLAWVKRDGFEFYIGRDGTEYFQPE